MYIRLSSIVEERLPEYDICIIGSGPAGVTLARELIGSGNKVCLLESGIERTTGRGNRLRSVRSVGIAIKERSRERVLGGASSTWSGLSAELDEVDFDNSPRGAVPGWPFTRDEIIPYWEQASARYRFPGRDDISSFSSLRSSCSLLSDAENIVDKVFLAASTPQRFDREWLGECVDAGIDVYTDATVTRLMASGGRVVSAHIRCGSDRDYELSAKRFVLAAGAIENIRLLLVSGLGNEYDQVGRYFMNHPKGTSGIITLRSPMSDCPYRFGCLRRGVAGYAGIRLDDSFQRAHRLLNSYVRFEPMFPWSDNNGVAGAVYIMKRMKRLYAAWKKNAERATVPLRDYAETGDDSTHEESSSLPMISAIASVAMHLPSVVMYAYYRLGTRHVPAVRRIRLRNFMEMEPSSENRVTLGVDVDEHGTALPVVSHQSSGLDRQSLMTLHDQIRSTLSRSGLGVLESNLSDTQEWPVRLDASHHLGGTRAGLDPATSVVDVNLRVHSVENLYCCGGSVFSSSGCANPTFTICALSIRLARHLAAL